MQLAHSNNRPPVPYTAYTAHDGHKSPKNGSMRSYRRLEILALSFRSTKR